MYPPRDIRPFVMYCVNGKPRSSLLIDSTDSMILLIFIHVYSYNYTSMSVRNFVYSKDLEGSCGQYSVANCRCYVSASDLRKSMWRLSKIDVATFEDRCIAFRRSTIDVTMCRPSKIDVSTFGDRCVDLRRSMCRPSEIDVLTFEDR